MIKAITSLLMLRWTLPWVHKRWWSLNRPMVNNSSAASLSVSNWLLLCYLLLKHKPITYVFIKSEVSLINSCHEEQWGTTSLWWWSSVSLFGFGRNRAHASLKSHQLKGQDSLSSAWWIQILLKSTLCLPSPLHLFPLGMDGFDFALG